jgi:tripartite-type tricarboxylate transporter receptor subunit TctC
VLGGMGTFAANQTLYRKPLYNAATDFAPVILIDEQPIVLIVRKDFPSDNLSEFIAYARANEAKMQYGSAGPGSGSHLACVLFNATVGFDATHIPYRASIMAIQDLIASRIDYTCPLISVALPLIGSNQVKALAILSKVRSPIMPNLPSAQEQGLVDFEAYYWDAFFLPKGTPAPIVQKLHDATDATMNIVSVQRRLNDLGMAIVAPERRSQAYLQTFVDGEIEKWARVIKTAGVSAD